MKQVTLIRSVASLVLIAILAGCSGKAEKKEPTKAEQEAFTAKREKALAWKGTYRDITHFDIKTGNAFFDSLYAAYQKTAVLTQDTSVNVGEYNQLHQKLVNTATNSTLYFFKRDSDKYGFSNNQFWVVNDTLCFAREMYISINNSLYDTDTAALWRIEEYVYHFQGDSTICMYKSASCQDLDKFDLTLSGIQAVPASEMMKKRRSALKGELEELLYIRKSM